MPETALKREYGYFEKNLKNDISLNGCKISLPVLTIDMIAFVS